MPLFHKIRLSVNYLVENNFKKILIFCIKYRNLENSVNSISFKELRIWCFPFGQSPTLQPRWFFVLSIQVIIILMRSKNSSTSFFLIPDYYPSSLLCSIRLQEFYQRWYALRLLLVSDIVSRVLFYYDLVPLWRFLFKDVLNI